MDTFQSSALGKPWEYRAWFSDQVALVLHAKTNSSADLTCRSPNTNDPWSDVFHTAVQVKQVLLDMDATELQRR